MMGIIFVYYIYSFFVVLQNEKNERKDILFEVRQDDTTDNNNTGYKEEHILNPDTEISTNIVEAEEPCQQEAADQSDCILSIPVINLIKNVYTGANRTEHLERYELVTATDDMQYKNGGNYIICGHASRLYGHSLNRIKEIQKGDIIFVKTVNKTDKYIVNKVSYENMYNTSNYCNQTIQKSLTIISCAKYVSDESYIVIYAELQ